MSDFGNYIYIQKTRKPHKCIYCNRTIPVGKSAWKYVGMWENEFQSWYSDCFCDDNKEISGYCEEGISGDEFDEWLRESDYGRCPNCCERYQVDSNWDETEESVNMECEICDTKWSVYIGFERAVESVGNRQGKTTIISK